MKKIMKEILTLTIIALACSTIIYIAYSLVGGLS
jgi:hypothetical protein